MNMALVGSVSLPAPRDIRTKLLDRAIIARAGLHFSWERSMNRTNLSSTLLSSLSFSSSSMNVRSSASTTNSGGTSEMAILLEVEGYVLHRLAYMSLAEKWRLLLDGSHVLYV